MKRRALRVLFTALFILLFINLNVISEPLPGDIFREYIRHWKNDGHYLRVGGKYDYGGSDIKIPEQFDLSMAVKAEVEIQKCLCHAQTSGLSISVNGNDWRLFPESPYIPAPQENYQHQFNPIIEIPLDELKTYNNNFKLKVNEDSADWPQNLVYGVVFRIYYKETKPHVKGEIVTPKSGDAVGRVFSIAVEADEKVKQVDFLGYYRGFDWNGDGNFHDWHGHIYYDKMIHHLGTDSTIPFRTEFDTSWIPDQEVPMKFSARIVGENGIIYMAPAVGNIELNRPGISVKMREPYDVSEKWVSRLWKKGEKVDILGDLSNAIAAKMMWVSWSGGYANGINVNGDTVLDKATRVLYRSDWNVVDLPLKYLKQGTNVIRTLQSEETKHGMEVQWPGIVVMIQYSDYVPYDGPLTESEQSQEITAPAESELPKMDTVMEYSFANDPGFETKGGVWNVKNGRLHLSETENVMPLGNIAVFEEIVENTYTIETICKVSDFSNWDDFAVIFGYQDPDNYYFVSFNEQNDPNTNGILLHKDGNTTELIDFDEPTSAGKDHKIEIIVIDGTIWVLRDSIVLGSVTDKTFSNGRIGYGSRNNICEFDNLLVKESTSR